MVPATFYLRGGYHFLAFDTIQIIIKINMPTRINAHHIPALKIVSTTPQLLSVTRVNSKMNNNDDDCFINGIYFLVENSRIIPFSFL